MLDIPLNPENDVVLRSMTARYFRGFNSEITLPLDASAVIIAGPNGRGKTSLYDALQWLFLGRIPRLEDLRFKTTEEHIVNRYAPPGERARVSVELAVTGNGIPAVATRTGNRQGTVLEVNIGDQSIVGENAEQWLRDRIMSAGRGAEFREGVTVQEFHRNFLTSALLEQDKVRAFLSSGSASDRYETLAQLLGLAVLDDFVDALEGSERRYREIVTQREQNLEIAEKAVSEAQGDSVEALARIAAAPYVEQTEIAFESARTQPGVHLQPRASDQTPIEFYEIVIGRAQSWLAGLASVDAIVTNLKGLLERRPLQSLSVLEDQRLEATGAASLLEGLLEQAVGSLGSAEAALVSARHAAEALQSLASAALPLLTNHCPVCTQPINELSVRIRLEQLLTDYTVLSSAEDTYHAARDEVESLRGRISEGQQELRAFEDQIATVVQWTATLDSLLAQATNVANDLRTFAMPPITTEADNGELVILDIGPWLASTRNSIGGIMSAATAVLAAHRAVQEQTRLESINIRLQARVAEAEAARVSVQSAESAFQARRDLVRIARSEAANVVGDTFRELEPVVQDVFARLAPHPTFDKLTFSHEVFRRQGSSIPIALDGHTGTEINPSVVFSSAQANVAALCYFIGLAFASGESDFGFVLMDDPLQSMDDVNALGFSDLCRSLRKEKQLIISDQSTPPKIIPEERASANYCYSIRFVESLRTKF